MFDIFHRVGINASPEKVFDALTTISGLRNWWLVIAGGDGREGGKLDIVAFEMQVLKAEANRLVHWKCTQGPEEWVATELTFRLEWKEEQTFVLFRHAKWREATEFLHHTSTKWATFLLSLRDAVETGEGRPIPHDLKIFVGD